MSCKTVGELIAELQKFTPDTRIGWYVNEDGDRGMCEVFLQTRADFEKYEEWFKNWRAQGSPSRYHSDVTSKQLAWLEANPEPNSLYYAADNPFSWRKDLTEMVTLRFWGSKD